jgi:hypothetical protein
MTDLRFLQLKALVDECTSKVNCVASIQHSVCEDNIFISIFWADEYHSFTARDTYHVGGYNSTADDNDMTKAEAFMRLLMRSAMFDGRLRKE